jgi:predicted nucleotidyltransferase
VAADQKLLTALAALQRALDETGAPSMIIGGIAVIGRGVPRDTSDIDAAVWGYAIEPEDLLAVLAKHDMLPREEDPIGIARQLHMVLVKHQPTGVTLDISLAWLPFEREAMSRASEVDFGGVPIRTATPEDLIVYKATAWRDRDRADIHRLLTLHGRTIDVERVLEHVRQIADVMDEPERAVIIEQMIREAQ